jgi:hypothetical protein
MEGLMAVAITRTELSARALRAVAAKATDARAARRMPAIAQVPEGVGRKIPAERCGMDRQRLRDWDHRNNADGREGLSNLRLAGPTPRFKADRVHPHSRDPLQPFDNARPGSAKPVPTFARRALARHRRQRWRKLCVRVQTLAWTVWFAGGAWT